MHSQASAIPDGAHQHDRSVIVVARSVVSSTLPLVARENDSPHSFAMSSSFEYGSSDRRRNGFALDNDPIFV